MRLFAKLVAALLVLLVIAVVFVWMTVPLNVPWRSMLQQAGLLPGMARPCPDVGRRGRQSIGGSGWVRRVAFCRRDRGGERLACYTRWRRAGLDAT